jgi:hypothetical protein
MELGIYTFAATTPDPDGDPVRAAQRLSDLLEEIELADQTGLDVFGVSEHHRADFVVSAPAVVRATSRAPAVGAARRHQFARVHRRHVAGSGGGGVSRPTST